MQIQSILESANVKPEQLVVMEKLTMLALLFAVDIGLLTGFEADQFHTSSFTPRPASVEHMEARMRLLPLAVQLVKALLAVCNGSAKPELAVKGIADSVNSLLQVSLRDGGLKRGDWLGWTKENRWEGCTQCVDSEGPTLCETVGVLLDFRRDCCWSVSPWRSVMAHQSTP